MKTQQTDQRWDDIIFENRNKIYGAYAIRQGYPVNVLRALLLCVGAVAGIFISPPQPTIKDLKDIAKSDNPAGPIAQPRIKPDRPKEIGRVKKITSSLLPTRITTSDVPDVKPEDIVVGNSDLSDNTDNLFIESGNDNLPPVETVEPVKPQPFLIVAEVMPSYEGGTPEMIKFIQRKLRYPTYAARAGVTGTVYVSFIVSVNGSITHVEIVKGIDKSCDEEAIRVISMMNRWKPGMQNKIPVAVRMVLPIKFIARE